MCPYYYVCCHDILSYAIRRMVDALAHAVQLIHGFAAVALHGPDLLLYHRVDY